MLYDMTRYDTFTAIKQQDIKATIVTYVVGNKMDKEDERAVEEEDA